MRVVVIMVVGEIIFYSGQRSIASIPANSDNLPLTSLLRQQPHAPELPPGWMFAIHPGSNRQYFYNVAQNRSQWQHPLSGEARDSNTSTATTVQSPPHAVDPTTSTTTTTKGATRTSHTTGATITTPLPPPPPLPTTLGPCTEDSLLRLGIPKTRAVWEFCVVCATSLKSATPLNLWARAGAAIMRCTKNVDGVSLASPTALATPGAMLELMNQTLFFHPCPPAKESDTFGSACRPAEIMMSEFMVAGNKPNERGGPSAVDWFLAAKKSGKRFLVCDPRSYWAP